MPFVPFTQRAKRWEPIAIALRQLACVEDGDNVDPEGLAQNVRLPLFDARCALEGFPQRDRDHLLNTARDRWSGGVLPKPLPNGDVVCILNPTHPRRRNRITLMEEIVHVHRRHVPTGLREVTPGLRVREYNEAQEMEAYGVGAAVLLPWSSFYHALDSGQPIHTIADHYDVTAQLVEYRIKITGATNLYRNRSRRS
jgi:IrrE N-terminal-like domain